MDININWMDLSLMILPTIVYGFIFYILYLIIECMRKYLRNNNSVKNTVIGKRKLSEILKQHRNNKKFTQEFVAESIGVTRQAVSKWENGSCEPSTTNLLALAKLYNITVDQLLNGNDN